MKIPGMDVIAPYSLGANVALALVALCFIWLYAGAKSKVEEEIGRCNADKLQSTLDAERITNQEQLANQARRSVQLASELARMKAAKDMAEESGKRAEEDLEAALAAIRNPARDDDASKCLDQYIPESRISRLRN